MTFWTPHAELAGHYTTREEWLELRRTGIGSSDCSAVLGMGKYGSPFSVWLEKTGRARPAQETEAMMWGTILEPVIRAELGRRLRVEITTSPTLRSLARPWQLYNPDGLIEDENALVEIKNASNWLAQEWRDGEVPDHAELQIQHGCAVTGADGAYVAGLIGGNHMRYEFIPRDDHLINHVIIPAELHMWSEYIVPDKEPPIDGSDATAEAIAQRWPRRRQVAEPADDVAAVEDAVAAYQLALATEKQAKADKALAVNQLTAMMRGADALTDGIDGPKLVARKSGQFREKEFLAEEPTAPEWLHKIEAVDRARMRSEDPELFARYQSSSIYIPKGK